MKPNYSKGEKLDHQNTIWTRKNTNQTKSNQVQKVQSCMFRAVYETLTNNDKISKLLFLNKRFTSAGQRHEILSFLRQETKENSLTLHLNGKDRMLCIDMVPIGVT